MNPSCEWDPAEDAQNRENIGCLYGCAVGESPASYARHLGADNTWAGGYATRM